MTTITTHELQNDRFVEPWVDTTEKTPIETEIEGLRDRIAELTKQVSISKFELAEIEKALSTQHEPTID